MHSFFLKYQLGSHGVISPFWNPLHKVVTNCYSISTLCEAMVKPRFSFGISALYKAMVEPRFSFGISALYKAMVELSFSFGISALYEAMVEPRFSFDISTLYETMVKSRFCLVSRPSTRQWSSQVFFWYLGPLRGNGRA